MSGDSGGKKEVNRRQFLKAAGGLGAAACLSLSGLPGNLASAASPEKFTPWGWPEPYGQVSEKSLKWLDSKGWLPLSIGFFADLPGYSGYYAVMRDLKLLEKRGLPVKYSSFLCGPPILESYIGGNTQVTGYGDFPFWTTVERGTPSIAYAVTAVNYEAAMLVRPDSPLKSIKDLKGRSEPVVIGTLLGSFLEFYISAAADVLGLRYGKDYKLAGMSLREAQFIPKGIDAVVMYDPFPVISIEKGLGRKIDDAFPYYFNKGYDFVRKEIHENAPDVVQAISDANLESILYTRYDIDKAVEMYHKDPRVRSAYSFDLFKNQTERYTTSLKPSHKYINADFWAAQDEVVVQSQFKKNRMKRALSVQDLKNTFATNYMANSLGKVGFAVPAKPVFLPAGWNGTVGKPPYPPYYNLDTMKGPQPFPEKGDLTKDWQFKGKLYRP